MSAAEISTNTKMLLIFVDETAKHGETSLYEAVVRRLLARGVAGATVNRGVMGFGVHLHLHRRRLLGVSDDRPVTITAVDGEARIREVIPEVRELLAGQGLIVLLDAEVIKA